MKGWATRPDLNVNERLKGSLLKIERAKKHVRDLDNAIRAFCNSEPYVLTVEEHADISHVRFKVSDIKAVPDEIGIILGDAIHNLRSSFDHLMWQLVGTPSSDNHIYFPICKTPQQYSSAFGKREVCQLRTDIKELLSAIQPKVSGDDTLWHIHELDLVDKHRLVLAVTAINTNWIIELDDRSYPFPFMNPGPLVDSQNLFFIPTATYKKVGHQNFKLGLDITFAKSEVVAGKPVLETLNGMAKLVSDIITKFEPFLS